MTVEMNKADGTLSKSMVWNIGWLIATGIFGVAVLMLPDIEKIVPPEIYVLIALIVKGVDVGLRQITTQPLKGK